ncbi:regulatory protein RecX [Flavobacterium okayamense]|nr:regulatory protein RecX [Flavobacterium okayamense]
MKSLTIQEIQNKMEYFCAYQERCYKDVNNKLNSFSLIPEAREKILTYLIENNFINEERFAKSFARGKNNYKNWGKNRIIQELKFRDISQRIIQSALAELSEDDYLEKFNSLAEKHWNTIKERKGPKKNKKFVDFLLRKGYESNLIFEKLNELNNNQ